MPSERIKLLRDCGPKFPANSVVELDEKTKAGIEAVGLVEGTDYERVVADESAAEAIRASIGEEVRSQVRATFTDLESRLKKPHVEFGPEPVEKDPKRGFRHMGDFGQAVWLAGLERVPDGFSRLQPSDEPDRDPCAASRKRLDVSTRAERAAHRVRAVGSDEMSALQGLYGAWLIPTEFIAKLWSNTVEQGTILPFVEKINLSGRMAEWPAVDDTTHASGQLFGGISCTWRGETTQMAGVRPKLATINLALNELCTLIYVPEGLLQFSAISIEPLLTDFAAKAINWTVETAIFGGTGVGQPLGISKSAALTSVTRQTANKVDYLDVATMKKHVPGYLWPEARFYYNPDVWPQLATMKLVIGTSTIPVWLPAAGSVAAPGGAAAAPYETVLGKPATQTEHCEALGAAGDILLCVPSQYAFATWTGGLQAAVSMHLRFDYAEQAFRYIMYADGRPLWKSGVTPEHGTATQTPYVVVAA